MKKKIKRKRERKKNVMNVELRKREAEEDKKIRKEDKAAERWRTKHVKRQEKDDKR